MAGIKPQFISINTNMAFKDWLNTFIDQNDLDRSYVFDIDHEDKNHLMSFEVLLESISSLPEKYQKKIKNKLVAIDSENGDLMHYLNWVALGFIKYNT